MTDVISEYDFGFAFPEAAAAHAVVRIVSRFEFRVPRACNLLVIIMTELLKSSKPFFGSMN